LGRGEGEGKKSKSKVKNAEGKKPMEWIEENGWEVLNGIKQGEEEGEWTYTGCLKNGAQSLEGLNYLKS
jgi:hypothetical protein